MSDRKPNPGPTCWDCGATNDPGTSECWLCQRRDWQRAPRHPMPMKPEPESSSGGGAVLVVLALGIVVIGGMWVGPGLVFLILIFVLPAWIAAEVMIQHRRDRGLPTSTASKLGLIAALTFMLVVAVMVAVLLICGAGFH